MSIDAILPDVCSCIVNSGPIYEKSRQRMEELITKNKHTRRYDRERDQCDCKNMFEISKKLHTIILSLFSHICKKSHSHVSSAKKSYAPSYSVSASLLYSRSDRSESPMRQMVVSSERYLTRCSHQATGQQILQGK